MISHYRWRRRFGPAGILGLRTTVTPRLSGSVKLSRWNHRFSNCSGIDELSNEGTFRFRPTSCAQRGEHSNDPLLPRMCQLFSLNFAATLSY